MPIQMATQLTAHRLIFPIKIKSGWVWKILLSFKYKNPHRFHCEVYGESFCELLVTSSFSIHFWSIFYRMRDWRRRSSFRWVYRLRGGGFRRSVDSGQHHGHAESKFYYNIFDFSFVIKVMQLHGNLFYDTIFSK